jgi:hypothetical protein
MAVFLDDSSSGTGAKRLRRAAQVKGGRRGIFWGDFEHQE